MYTFSNWGKSAYHLSRFWSNIFVRRRITLRSSICFVSVHQWSVEFDQRFDRTFGPRRFRWQEQNEEYQLDKQCLMRKIRKINSRSMNREIELLEKCFAWMMQCLSFQGIFVEQIRGWNHFCILTFFVWREKARERKAKYTRKYHWREKLQKTREEEEGEKEEEWWQFFCTHTSNVSVTSIGKKLERRHRCSLFSSSSSPVSVCLCGAMQVEWGKQWYIWHMSVRNTILLLFLLLSCRWNEMKRKIEETNESLLQWRLVCVRARALRANEEWSIYISFVHPSSVLFFQIEIFA